MFFLLLKSFIVYITYRYGFLQCPFFTKKYNNPYKNKLSYMFPDGAIDNSMCTESVYQAKLRV